MMLVRRAHGSTLLRPFGTLVCNLLIHIDSNSVNFSGEVLLKTTNLNAWLKLILCKTKIIVNYSSRQLNPYKTLSLNMSTKIL